MCPAVRVAVEVQGGQWVSGRHTRGGTAYRDEIAKLRRAALEEWTVLCYTTDDITGKDQGIPAVVEVAAAYERRPTFTAYSAATLFPSLDAWEAAGGALRVLDDSEGLPSPDERIAAFLMAWRSTVLGKLANLPGDPAALANPNKPSTE